MRSTVVLFLYLLDPTSLLAPGGGVQCMLVNERGAEQRMAPLLERRGIVVVKLLDQVCALMYLLNLLHTSCSHFIFIYILILERHYQQVASGRDDRQMVFLPPGTSVAGLAPGKNTAALGVGSISHILWI